MASPYPALITDANSETRIAGQITFTDPANQPGGGSPVVQQFKATLTPAMIQASSVTLIELAPAPGVGKTYIDATSLWSFGAGFTAYGAAFQTVLSIGSTIGGGSVVFTKSDVGSITSALKGGSAGDVVGVWFGALLGSSWSSDGLLDNCPYYFSSEVTAPTGGAGNITVVSAMTVIDAP